MALIPNAQLAHCSFVVPDLDAAVNFFVTYFGFTQVSSHGPIQFTTGDYLTRTFAVPERAIGRRAIIQQGAAQLELVEWIMYGEPLNPLRESSFPGCQIALLVPDLTETMATLSGIPRMRFLEMSPDGFVYCFTPYGFQLRLMESSNLT